MPISPMISLISQQIQTASKMDVAGNSNLTSLMLTQAVATSLPTALFPQGPFATPLSPIGFPICQNLLKTAFTLGIAGNPTIVAQTMALAFSLLSPICPPTGIALLTAQLEQVFNLNIAGRPEITSQMMALAITNYFLVAPTI